MTLCIGKHKGKTYEQIQKEDPGYCSWVATVPNPSGPLAEFAKHLKSNGSGCDSGNGKAAVKQAPACHRAPLKRKLDNDDFLLSATDCDLLPPDLDDAYPPPPAASLVVENRRNGPGCQAPAPRAEEAAWAAAAAAGLMDALPVVASTPPHPLQAETTAGGSTNDRSIIILKAPATKVSPLEAFAYSGGVQLGACASPERKKERITLECTAIAVELLDAEQFKVASVETRHGRQIFSTFLPRPLYERLMSLGAEQRAGKRGQALTLPAAQYAAVIKAIREEFSVEIQAIPDFVLRSFDKFRHHAKAVKLQRKCAAILMGQQTPRTIAKSSDVLTLMGEQLQSGLRPFQVAGVEFGLRRNGRCIIGDEMGLGKTLQALAVAAVYQSEWPLLVICPSSVMFQWRDQAKRWLIHLLPKADEQVFVVKAGKDTVPQTARVVLISYDLIAKNKKFQEAYQVVVCDESHYLKSWQAKRTQAIVPIVQKARRAILLSGTPALNKPSELFQQLAALLPDFARHDEFANRYCDSKVNPWSKRVEYSGSKHDEELYQFLTKTAMIRRLKKNVQTELPPKLRSRIPIECAEKDLKEIRNKMAELGGAGDGGLEGLFASVTVATAPKEGDPGETENRPPTQQKSARNLMSELFVLTGNAKARGACDYVSYLLQLDCKFIVFAHHKAMLDALEVQVAKEKVKFVRVDGTTPQAKREVLIKSFQESDEFRVAVLSITACGHGLNLTASGTVVFAELYWVPGQIIQAEDRCHRMGTTFSSIQIHYLIAEGTVDDMVWKTLNKKWSAVTSTLNGETETIEAQQRTRAEAAGSAMSPARANRSQLRIGKSLSSLSVPPGAKSQKQKPSDHRQLSLNFARLRKSTGAGINDDDDNCTKQVVDVENQQLEDELDDLEELYEDEEKSETHSDDYDVQTATSRTASPANTSRVCSTDPVADTVEIEEDAAERRGALRHSASKRGAVKRSFPSSRRLEVDDGDKDYDDGHHHRSGGSVEQCDGGGALDLFEEPSPLMQWPAEGSVRKRAKVMSTT